MRRTRTGDKVDEGQKDGEGRVFPQTCAIVMERRENVFPEKQDVDEDEK